MFDKQSFRFSSFTPLATEWGGEDLVRKDIADEIKQIVGAQHVLERFEDKYCYIYDASAIDVGKDGVPSLIVFPGSADEISSILKLANQYKFPVIPRGAGSNVSGGTVSHSDAVIIVLKRLDRILEIDERNMMAEAEVGVITAELTSRGRKEGTVLSSRSSEPRFLNIGRECGGKCWRTSRRQIWRDPRLRAEPRSRAAHRRDHSHRR